MTSIRARRLITAHLLVELALRTRHRELTPIAKVDAVRAIDACD